MCHIPYRLPACLLRRCRTPGRRTPCFASRTCRSSDRPSSCGIGGCVQHTCAASAAAWASSTRVQRSSAASATRDVAGTVRTCAASGHRCISVCFALEGVLTMLSLRARWGRYCAACRSLIYLLALHGVLMCCADVVRSNQSTTSIGSGVARMRTHRRRGAWALLALCAVQAAQAGWRDGSATCKWQGTLKLQRWGRSSCG